MNSLLSLSFLNPGPANSVTGSVIGDTGSTKTANADSNDAMAAADDFGRLLNQSSEQHDTDRQSFAGFNLATKTKQTATLPADKTEPGDITLPPVIPPGFELTDADEQHAITLLSVLQQAGITTKQLAAIADKQSDSKLVTAADAGMVKIEKGQWFTLPIAPQLPEKAIAGSEQSAGEVNVALSSEALKKDPENTTDTKDKKNNASAATLNAELAAAAGTDNSDDVALPSAVAKHNNASDSSGSKSDLEQAKFVAGERQTASQSNTGVTGSADAAKAGLDETIIKVLTAAEEAEQSTIARGAAEKVGLTGSASLAGKADTTDTKVVTAANAEQATQNPFLGRASQATTIFDNAGKTNSAEADAASVLAANPAGAAVMSDSDLAKQQLKAGLADAGSAAKTGVTADSVDSESGTKPDSTFTTAGQRIETTPSGFSNLFNNAVNSGPAETAAARLEAANVVGAQQLADQAKTQRTKPTVTEQLKQVNLLEQNAAGQLKERINMMVRQHIQVAEIRLDPADLGQMQIRVNLQQEQASVQFIVQQQHAKELLEQQMPRLREMLQQQGIQLGEGQVQQQRQGESQANGQRSGAQDNGQTGPQTGDEQATAVTLEVKLSERLVDFYA